MVAAQATTRLNSACLEKGRLNDPRSEAWDLPPSELRCHPARHVITASRISRFGTQNNTSMRCHERDAELQSTA